MRAAAIAIGVLVLAGVGIVSVVKTRGQLQVIEACDAAGRGDIQRTLELTETLVGPDPNGRDAAECRCRALLARGDAAACSALLDPLVGDGEKPDWVPRPELAELLIHARREAGRGEAATRLARSAGAAHPEDVGLFLLELELRAAREPEAALLRELDARIPPRGEAAARMRVAVAQRFLMRGDPPAALEMLGAEPVPDAGAGAALWFDTLGIAHALNDDLARAREAYARWLAGGGRPREVRARYALALSVSGLGDPDLDPLTALRGALADALALGDARLTETVAVRLIFTLVAAGENEAALAVYDEVTQRLPLPGVQREELERAQLARQLERKGPGPTAAGPLVFELAEGAAEGTLWVSPPPDAEPDAPYETHPLRHGRPVRIERAVSAAPQRWVLRAGEALASGTVRSRPGAEQRIALEAEEVRAALPDVSLERKPSDGERRVLLLLLDCGDWSIVQYLRTRGDLPVLAALLDEGYRAVLDSDPPLTAAALESLVWPSRRSDASLLGTFYRFGVELAGLESVGRNPVEWLSWLLPESDDLFSTLGGETRRVANLLLAHGGVRAGRHGIVHGPHGRRESLELGRSRRPLDAGERRRFPALAGGDAMDTHYVETLAAEFDATETLLAEGGVDLIAVRIEPLDILTHAHFGEVVREGNDDGRGLLFETYRYIDARIGALHRHLDADDALLVFSDHGIETAMQHARPALFVATGAGIPRGRAAGRPALRGVSRVAADLLGIETSWPDTGVAPWASSAQETPR